MENECFEMGKIDLSYTYFGLDPKRDLMTALNLCWPHLPSDNIPSATHTCILISSEALGYLSSHYYAVKASLHFYCHFTHSSCSVLPLSKSPEGSNALPAKALHFPKSWSSPRESTTAHPYSRDFGSAKYKGE